MFTASTTCIPLVRLRAALELLPLRLQKVAFTQSLESHECVFTFQHTFISYFMPTKERQKKSLTQLTPFTISINTNRLSDKNYLFLRVITKVPLI